MKSSTGAHFIALDHVRALAAFMVFAWHFLHSTNGYPVPFGIAPRLFPLALLDEGHTGVALFMTLSGYLFAKLLDGKVISYRAFLWNRILRLVPLLFVVLLIIGIMKFAAGDWMRGYAYEIAKGVIFPTLPNGGWSITVELHYYLALPVLLWMFKKSRFLPISLIVAAIAIRLLVYFHEGQIQSLAYWTIVGRIDQFVLGMIAFQFRACLTRRHFLVTLTLLGFAAFYWYFDSIGGFYHLPSYPSPSLLWIFLPTIEGVAYAIGIAWYESSFTHSTTGVSALVGKIGEYSYSIYLLHFFFVFKAATFVHTHVMEISNFYVASLWSAVFFLMMLPLGYLSFRFIEGPFLKLRTQYVTRTVTAGDSLLLNRTV